MWWPNRFSAMPANENKYAPGRCCFADLSALFLVERENPQLGENLSSVRQKSQLGIFTVRKPCDEILYWSRMHCHYSWISANILVTMRIQRCFPRPMQTWPWGRTGQRQSVRRLRVSTNYAPYFSSCGLVWSGRDTLAQSSLLLSSLISQTEWAPS